jgi:ppGpp synthetase/RelA/SpoT-type nucleotidyltranferase
MADFSKDKLHMLLKNGLGSDRFSAQIQSAFEIAHRGHQGQYRDQCRAEDARVPYIVHPIGVALTAAELLPLAPIEDSFDDLISACLTHDLIEDSDVTPQDLRRATSQRTAEIVIALTKPPIPGDASRQQRNDRFVRQIIASGRTATFIKMCDHLHNISRPQNTPPNLLDKAIQKGRSSYLKLFDENLLPSSLRNEFLKRLEIAETYRGERGGSAAKSSFASLSEAIDFCVSTTERKVLEVHDILDTLQVVSGAVSVALLTNEQFVTSLFPEAPDAATAKTKAQILGQLKKGQLDRSQLPKDIQERNGPRVGTVFSLDIGMEEEKTGSLRAILNVAPQGEAGWLTLNNLHVIASYLSQRLKIMQRNRLRDLAAGLAQLQIDVDPEEAFALHLTHADLIELKHAIDRAEYVRNILHSGIMYRFGVQAQKANSLQIVSRVKSPRSILRKMKARHYSGFGLIEDLVGIRVVCESASAAKTLAVALHDYLRSENSQARISELSADADATIHEISSISGYKAFHVGVFVSSAGEPDGKVGCEVQIRSVFQDAWARISQEVSYKKDRVNQRRTKDSLKRLAELRDTADAIIDRL